VLDDEHDHTEERSADAICELVQENRRKESHRGLSTCLSVKAELISLPQPFSRIVSLSLTWFWLG
jgi:hypothetical protein